ncbi:MAG: putative integral rane protein, partial [Clostridiales bacterium]|nr:putative integral rane protein [Clostridiales bacterium]
SPKFPGAFFIPLMEIFMTLVFVFLPKFDPKKENYAKFNKAYTVFMFVMVVFFTAIQLVILGVSMGADFIKVDTIVKLLVGLLILIIGNLMPKLKHNYFMGIKTPWTLSSESVWLKTHRHGGVVWFAAGVLMVLLAFIPGQISAAAYFSITIIAALEPILYSFLCYRKEV